MAYAQGSETRDLYEIGEVPPLGHVPARMYAWTIRPDRQGNPVDAMRVEVLPTWEIRPNEVLVLVMAAGINFNGVWASLGKPVSVFDIHKLDYHVAGSDASGIVWAVGSEVRRWKVGDEVVVHCNQVSGDDEECNGGDPMLSSSQRIWGYESPDGSFAQFTRVQAQQLMAKPSNLGWESAASYVLTLSTAYRMLFGHPPHTLLPGQNVLVWGAAGGLGVAAIQLCALVGARAIAVVSTAERAQYVRSLGASGVIDRSEFTCWGKMPALDTEEYARWLAEARRFGRAIWAFTGKGNNVDIVFEHPGQATFPVSCLLAKRGGMIVFCAGSTGYEFGFDARYVWMHQKRIQGSHFAHLKQAAEASRLVAAGRIDPCLGASFEWQDLPKAHAMMLANQHPPGNMAVRVCAREAEVLPLRRR